MLFKLIMAGLREIDMVSFFGNIFILVVIEGYLNFVIFSHLAKEMSPIENEDSNEDEEVADAEAMGGDVQLDSNNPILPLGSEFLRNPKLKD